MEVRESILKRIKDIRKEEVEICVGHNVKQEEKLSEFRMDIMAILLKLVDLDANSIESLREVGDSLIAFRLKISTEVRDERSPASEEAIFLSQIYFDMNLLIIGRSNFDFSTKNLLNYTATLQTICNVCHFLSSFKFIASIVGLVYSFLGLILSLIKLILDNQIDLR